MFVRVLFYNLLMVWFSEFGLVLCRMMSGDLFGILC